MSPEKTVAVIGVGNILMGDEGLGVRVLDLLRPRLDEFGGRVELVDAGTALLDVLDDYTSCDVLLVIDVVRGGGDPGTVYRFDLPQFDAAPGSGVPTSLHELSVLDVLEMERLTGRTVPRVVVIGMEPETIRPGLELSRTVQERTCRLVETVLDELRGILNAEREPETQK